MNTHLQDYHTELNLRIDWSELNLFGHVSNVEFFKYIQASRVHYWEEIGMEHTFRDFKIGPILASTSCQFKQQLYYPGNIKVLVKTDYIKNTSFAMTHLILNEQHEIAGIGKDIIVLFDYNTNQKISIPSDIRNSIQKKEKKIFENLSSEN
jgi:acyl-CoA thioester hydrolase